MQRSREYTIDDFIVQKKIGEGSFGSVYKAVFKDTNEPVAIKKIKLSSQNRSDVKNVANEVRVLCSIEHPNIVSYKCSFWDKYQSNICIVMEYVGGGDLSSKIASYKRKKALIPEGTIWTYLIQMLKGLKVLHDLKIIHRDIKAANVFLSQDETEVKLGDMNVSKVVENNFTKTRVGTPLYFSPEIWNGKSYDYKTDVWSLGCLLYELCALTYPFNGHSMNDLRFSANRGRYAPIPTVYSKELNDLIRLCLQVEDYKRPNVDKLLEHPVVREKLKKAGEGDVPLGEARLIDTIQIPYDFRKMKLPSKKLLPKRSNSSGNIRASRPSSSNPENKENGNPTPNLRQPIKRHDGTGGS
jgi:NIMA (never in mitosis gene a)-related kinase